MNTQLINIAYVWNDDEERNLNEAIAAIGEYDGVSNDDHVFYWFAPGEPIVGDHGEFTVLDWEAA